MSVLVYILNTSSYLNQTNNHSGVDQIILFIVRVESVSGHFVDRIAEERFSTHATWSWAVRLPTHRNSPTLEMW